MVQLMKDPDCQRVKLGFESGSDKILKDIQKDETTDDMIKGTKKLLKEGVPFTPYFMTGFPNETDEDLKKTIELEKIEWRLLCFINIISLLWYKNVL